jgi:hypothetical protein
LIRRLEADLEAIWLRLQPKLGIDLDHQSFSRAPGKNFIPDGGKNQKK